MPDDDYFDEEAARFGEPVHPDDRLWRHPSELNKVPPPGARSIPDTVDFAPVPRRRSVWLAIAVSSLVGAAVAVSVVMATGAGERVVERWIEPDELADAGNPPTSIVVTTTTSTAPAPPTLSELAEAAAPSMAWITVTNGDASAERAGVIISPEGHVLTDSEPFADHSAITVRLADGSLEPAVLAGVDPLTGLAVIRVQRDDLLPARLGDPRALRVGAQVLILEPDETGRPAASTAMVNAVGTPARLDDSATLYDMIQFDAPVPIDHTGGPLLNSDGEVVGLTIRAGNGATYGYATPIDSAHTVAVDLIAEGRARHPWLGIEGRQEHAQPVVVSVQAGSPAEAAGLLPQDVILRVDGDAVPSMAAFVTAVRTRRPGDAITISYLRDGAEYDCVAVLGLRD